VGVEVEACAQCYSLRSVTGGGCADRCHALVSVGCAGQPGPVRVSVSLRTLARRTRRSGGGGCPASPGRRTCCVSPGGSGLGPVPAGLRRGRCDDRARFESFDHCADGHGAAGAVGHGFGLVGEAAGGDASPRALVAVALPAAGGAGGPFPAGCGGPVGGLAVPQLNQAPRAVLRGVPGRDRDHHDAHLGSEVPYPVHDPAAHRLRHAGVQGAAHALGFHRPQVFQVDDARPGRDGLVHSPPCGSPRQRLVAVRPARGHS
jgi:hypothetical protein